jgi:DNA polymerase
LAAPITSPRNAASEAEKLAIASKTLDELHDAIRCFEGCSLKRGASSTVLMDGNPSSDLLLIGEAPGAEEDRQGIPFCGPSGKLLDKMLGSIGRDRTTSCITNMIYWRPPGNRKPSTEEILICQSFVWRHIALIRPKLVVLVGGTAASGLLDTQLGITRLRGKPYSLTIPSQFLEQGEPAEIPAQVLFHPSFLLRQPNYKRLAWQDLLSIRRLAESQ